MRLRCLLRYNDAMKKMKLKNDILLLLAVLVLAGVLWGVLALTRRQGGTALVTVDGETVAELPLARDAVLPLTLEDGGTNTVVVESGRVCVREANCPDLVCVRGGWIRYAGETLVCLPHRLVVTVTGGETGTLDAVTGGPG